MVDFRLKLREKRANIIKESVNFVKKNMGKADRKELLIHLEAGDDVVILGKNGSGKSVLVNYIARKTLETKCITGGSNHIAEIRDLCDPEADKLVIVDDIRSHSLSELEQIQKDNEGNHQTVVVIYPGLEIDGEVKSLSPSEIMSTIKFEEYFKNPLIIWCDRDYANESDKLARKYTILKNEE